MFTAVTPNNKHLEAIARERKELLDTSVTKYSAASRWDQDGHTVWRTAATGSESDITLGQALKESELTNGTAASCALAIIKRGLAWSTPWSPASRASDMDMQAKLEETETRFNVLMECFQSERAAMLKGGVTDTPFIYRPYEGSRSLFWEDLIPDATQHLSLEVHKRYMSKLLQRD